jgi:hypothetical protein
MLDPNDLFSGMSAPVTPVAPSAPIMQMRTPQDEIAYLQAEIAKREAQLAQSPQAERLSIPSERIEARAEIAHDVIEQYRQTPQEVLHPSHVMTEQEAQELHLNLSPEAHDRKIEELYSVMMARGVKNAFSVIEKMQNPHLDDDFHRFLVQYLAEAHTLPGLPAKNELYEQLQVTLYEVTLPRPNDEEGRKSFKEFVAVMEQFYAGMQSIFPLTKSNDIGFSVEIGRSYNSPQVVFYVSVPNVGADLFEKHVLGVYPTARLNPVADDYNVVNPLGIVAGSVAKYSADEILPIKLFDQFESDPINVLLNVFTKLKVGTEGAAIQLVLHPIDQQIYKDYLKILEKLRKGEKLKDLRKEVTVFSVASDMFKAEKKPDENKLVDDNAVEKITAKVSQSLMRATIRVVASAETQERAAAIVNEISSAFNQFSDPRSNGITFKPVNPNQLFRFAHEFTYRLPVVAESLVLNVRELATLYHFPALSNDSNELKQAQAATAPAPLNLSNDGILLGYNEHRGVKTPIRYAREDRVRHFYIIGQTGTGKTGFLMNMIIQDIQNGDGVCYLDPHGSDVQTILSTIPPERMNDVIYFDPAYTPRPMGLNMLEYDVNRPEQMSLIIDEMMNIFNQLFDMQAQGGAMFQQYFKNAAFTVMSHPESGSTLMEISRVMSDKAFRDMKLKHCKNPMVVQFWKNAESTTGEQGLQNFVPYITSKFDPLISNEFLRPIVTQEKSAFNMRDIMDNKKILLINLSKGLLGELNANLLGLILIGKIQMAALSRAESYGVKFPDFYLYIDEFQNFTTPAISSILSEARKYRLSLNVAHQFMAQLDDKIKNAVLGNVGSMAVCRISPEDAGTMEQYFKPYFGVSDIIKLENMTSYTKLLVNGVPAEPFNMKNNDIGHIYKSIAANAERVDQIKKMSYERFGRPRAEVEEEILQKFSIGSK